MLLRPGALFAQADAPSLSKIGLHLINTYTAGAQQVSAAHPRILKILGTGGAMMTAARDFKARTPDAVIVLRVFTTRSYAVSADPAASGVDFWNSVLAPAINGLSAADRALIDYVEGPNEGDSTPTWVTLADARWFNSFWLALAPLIGNAGFRPCAFSISVGNPPGSQTEIRQRLDAIAPALRECQRLGGGWSYHSYTIPYSMDVGQEIWYSLRYRQYYQYFATAHADLLNLPLLLTEGGVEPGGWMLHGSATKFQNWLAWYDARLREDAYVVGCTLFQSGDPGGWGNFEIEPIAGWLATHIGSTESPPAAPRNFRASAGNGQVALTWTPSAGAERFTVKRGTNPAGPFTTVASNLTSASFIHSPLAAGGPYFFTVSAASSHGQGPDSAVIFVIIPSGLSLTAEGSGGWRYLDNGSNPEITWRGLAFDDSSWKTGPAPLGYGDGDEATVVDDGPDTARHITTYFRRTFTLDSTAGLQALVLRFVRDDGIAVYLNGARVALDNLAADASHTTPADDPVTAADESAWHFVAVDPSTLITGTNVIAAEVHQSSGTSTDISFDLALRAYSGADLLPPRAFRNDGNIHISSPLALVDLALFSSMDLATWTPVTGVPIIANNESTLTLPLIGRVSFFRLQVRGFDQ
ncbi:MAG: hypothetical protein ACR2OZ_00360 [Verrucomicrobiales bacterium]